MEAAINYGLCRCCASEGSFKDLEKTYDWLGTEEVYANMLKDCFDISLSKQDSFNNGGICEVCITQLRNASNFKKQVQQTEQQFLKKIEDNGYQTSIIKVEVARPDDDDHDLFDDGNLSDGFSSPEYDIPLTKIKVEKLNETKPKKRAAKPSTSKAKKLKKEAGEPSAKRTKKNKLRQPIKSENVVFIIKKERDALKESRIKLKTLRPSGELHKHYNNIKQLLTCTNATPIRQCGDFGYACCYCESQFHQPADLKKHTLDSHDDPIENASFTKRPDLCGLLIKLDITALQCKLCDADLDNLEDLFSHLKIVHDRPIHTDVKNQIVPFKFEGEKLKCFICHNEFNRFKILLSHMSVHYRNFVCGMCDAGYVNRRQFKTHIKNHDTGSYKCDECDKVFDTLTKKKSHAKLVHDKKNKVYKCSYCHEMLCNYRQKVTHMKRVHGIYTKFKCNACDQIFWSQHSLSIHTQRDHLMERRHKCTECDSTFFASTDLKEHMVKHTGERTYQCAVCLKSYGRKWTLREHMRIHANDRRFKCEHCGQAFVQKCSWRGHMRSQHGEDV
ncbi:zinc finger protein 808-like isoform X2 [Aricia agestis]|uniref:zinc finger protein 808-like isoform X2 n=1 Tax=Aricia agestis TaxID=91739 RepID=UPI001C20B2D8|nr:zinc finger protein 808-like isoform X2 [Aricia agestis]